MKKTKKKNKRTKKQKKEEDNSTFHCGLAQWNTE